MAHVALSLPRTAAVRIVKIGMSSVMVEVYRVDRQAIGYVLGTLPIGSPTRAGDSSEDVLEMVVEKGVGVTSGTYQLDDVVSAHAREACERETSNQRGAIHPGGAGDQHATPPRERPGDGSSGDQRPGELGIVEGVIRERAPNHQTMERHSLWL